MENKKKYFIAILLFIFIGLMIFTFANPKDDKEEDKLDGNKTQEVDDDESDKKDEDDDKEVTEDQNGSQDTNPTNGPEIVDDSYDKAKKLVEELQKLVDKSNSLKTLNTARDYHSDNEVQKAVDAVTNKDLQKELQDILDELSKLLDDTTAPELNVSNGTVYASNIEVTSDDENAKITVTNSEGKTVNGVLKDGKYTVKAVDDAFNEVTVEITVDTQAPKVSGVKNNTVTKDDVTLTVEDLTNTTVKVNGEETEDLTFTEDGKYEVELTDEVGNSTNVSFTIDKTAPTILINEQETTNGETYTYNIENPFEKIEVKDLTNISVTYTKDGEEVEQINGDGTYIVTAIDEIGNTTTITIVIDTKAIKLENISVYNNGANRDNHVATKGDILIVRVKVSEKSYVEYNGETKEGLLVKIGNSTNSYYLPLEGCGNNYCQYKDRNIVIDDTLATALTSGEKISVTVVDGKDAVGNPIENMTEDVSDPTEYVVYDNEPITIQDFYYRVKGTNNTSNSTRAKVGDKITIAIRTENENEEFAGDLTLKINGEVYTDEEGKPVTFTKKEEDNVTYFVNYTVPEDFKASENGIIEFEVIGLTDIAGNGAKFKFGSETFTSFTDKEVRNADANNQLNKIDPLKFDSESINASIVSFQVWENADKVVKEAINEEKGETYVTTGSRVAIKVTYDEKLASKPSFTIAGVPAIQVSDYSTEDGKTIQWVGYVDLPEGINVNSGDPIPFKVVAKDAAGNETVTESFTGNKKLIYDNEAPTLTIDGVEYKPSTEGIIYPVANITEPKGAVKFSGVDELSGYSGVYKKEKDKLYQSYKMNAGFTYSVTTIDKLGNTHTYRVHPIKNDSSSIIDALGKLEDGATVKLPSETISGDVIINADNVTIIGNETDTIQGTLSIEGNNVTLENVNVNGNDDYAILITEGVDKFTVNGGKFNSISEGIQGMGTIRIVDANDISIEGATIQGAIHLLNYRGTSVNIKNNKITLDHVATGEDNAQSGILITTDVSGKTFSAQDLYEKCGNKFDIKGPYNYYVIVESTSWDKNETVQVPGVNPANNIEQTTSVVSTTTEAFQKVVSSEINLATAKEKFGPYLAQPFVLNKTSNMIEEKITVTPDDDEEYQAFIAKGYSPVNVIWWAQFSCDTNKCVGFKEHGTNKLTDKTVEGRRGDVSITMEAPKAKEGYTFVGWEKSIVDYSGIKIQGFEAIYEETKEVEVNENVETLEEEIIDSYNIDELNTLEVFNPFENQD